jgi:hypothetical protein
MEFRNHTPFPALAFDALDQRDIRFHTVVMRLSFELQDDGTLAIAPEQTPLSTTDEYYGALNRSSVKQESDFAPYKPHTDVIVIADGVAPVSQRAQRKFTVGLHIDAVPSRQALPPPPLGLNPFQSASHEQMSAWRAACELIRAAPPRAATIVDKKLIVGGAREWQKRYLLTRALSLFTLPTWKLTAAAPLTQLPIRYEYACGGENKILVTDKAAKHVKKRHRQAGMLPQAAPQNRDTHDAHDAQDIPAIAHSASIYNTVGRGFAERWYINASKIKRLPAPQITAPHARIGSIGNTSRIGQAPSGFGVIARAWQPRLSLAGTYDQAWLEQRHPYLPADFNFAYWNGAPADQQIAPHLDGDERITLSNLCAPNGPGIGNVERDAAGNTRLGFSLPGHLPFVLVRFADGQIGELAAKLDTVLIDTAPDANDPAKKPMVVCVWRATLAAEPAVRVLEARMIAQTDVAILRAAQDGAQDGAPNRTPLFA